VPFSSLFVGSAAGATVLEHVIFRLQHAGIRLELRYVAGSYRMYLWIVIVWNVWKDCFRVVGGLDYAVLGVRNSSVL